MSRDEQVSPLFPSVLSLSIFLINNSASNGAERNSKCHKYKKKPNSLQLNRSPRSSSSLAVPCTTGGKLIDNAITGAQQKGQWGKNNQNWKCNETLALADRQGPSYPENCKNWWRKNCPNEIAIWMSPETNQPRTVTRLVPEHFRLPEFQGNDVFECSCKLPTRFHST